MPRTGSCTGKDTPRQPARSTKPEAYPQPDAESNGFGHWRPCHWQLFGFYSALGCYRDEAFEFEPGIRLGEQYREDAGGLGHHLNLNPTRSPIESQDVSAEQKLRMQKRMRKETQAGRDTASDGKIVGALNMGAIIATALGTLCYTSGRQARLRLRLCRVHCPATVLADYGSTIREYVVSSMDVPHQARSSIAHGGDYHWASPI